MASLHIKLGLVKQFVKALDKDGAAFKYLQNLLPKLSEAKVEGGIFIGPQVKLILKSDGFLEAPSAVEKDAWICFAAVVQGFLGNNKEDNYAELVANVVKSYGNMRCRMSMKVHMLDARLDDFKENLVHILKNKVNGFISTLKILRADISTLKIGLTRLGIKPESTVQERDALYHSAI